MAAAALSSESQARVPPASLCSLLSSPVCCGKAGGSPPKYYRSTATIFPTRRCKSADLRPSKVARTPTTAARSWRTSLPSAASHRRSCVCRSTRARSTSRLPKPSPSRQPLKF
eukprot:Amastigsp_a870411_3.p3 type:complete len:113 gc:universal Amastigsp_a870411_3:467-129(-)